MLLRLANWLYGLCAQHTAVAQPSVGQDSVPAIPLPTHLTLTRDKSGGFRPKDAPSPGVDPQADFLEANRITPRMQAAALAEYVPPEDAHDKGQLERRLREYIVSNLGTWVNGRHCNLQMVFAALKDTYAIDQKYYTTLLAAARAARAQAAPVRPGAGGNKRVLTYRTTPVGAERSLGPLSPLEGAGPCARPAVDSEPRGARRDAPLQDVSMQRRQTALPPHVVRDVSVAPPHGGTDAAATGVTTVSVLEYDPDYDVVANLSQKVKNALCPEGSYQGFGNDPQQAIESYYAKNRGEMQSYGGDWEMFGMGCKVYEQFDKQQRRYYVARVDGSVDRKEQEATLFGTVMEQAVGVAPARPAFTIPNSEEGRTGATPTVIGESVSETSRAASPLEPSPLNLEPSSRPPPHFLHILDPP